MLRSLLLLIVVALSWVPALAEIPPLAIASSEDQLSATLTYRGADVAIFGSADVSTEQAGKLAVTIVGPASDQELRRSTRFFGMVTQSAPTTFENVPAFWSINTEPSTASLPPSQQPLLDDQPEALRNYVRSQLNLNSVDQDLLQAQVNDGRLDIAPSIERLPGGLFRTRVFIPAFAPVGDYNVIVHWFGDDGSSLQSEPSTISVKRGRIANLINHLSNNRSFLYGLLCVLIAICGGVLSEVVFRRFAP